MQFNYTLNDNKSWPPLMRPKPPFGPMAIEVMRSCLLRSCFEASPNYERRTGVAARVGTALHRTLQSLNQQSIVAGTTEQLAAETRRRFLAEIREQQGQLASRPREQTLVWDHVRTNHALEAVISEAIRTQPLGISSSSAPYLQTTVHSRTQHEYDSYSSASSQNAPVEVEVLIRSKSGLFQGRIDRVEKTTDGIHLVDYKSAFRDDLPEHYTRQLQLYAFMWFETRGEWPIEAFVFYPMRGSFHNVSVEESICRQVAAESIGLIEKVTKKVRPTELASPGDVCKICEFRAWCHPFWALQRSEEKQLRACDKANIGFEGRVQTIKLENHYWYLNIDWHNALVKLIAPQERFLHLVNVRPGQHLRILDTTLKGQLFQPTAHVTDQSEIFIVMG
jgi:CRISPR/Cas system-associated exonuclease Cas4 (RecB family)